MGGEALEGVASSATVHVLWFGRNILDIHGFSTVVSVLILGGAGAGWVALILSVSALHRSRDTDRPVWERPPAPPPGG